MYNLCVFDMDGTFVNSIGDISDAMNRSLIRLGYAPYEESKYQRMVGDGMRVLCKRALPNNDERELEKLISLYKEDYLNNCCVKTLPYEGMVDLVSEIKTKGIKAAILSNKPHAQVQEIVSKLFEKDLFDEVIGQSEAFPPKPEPSSLFYIMKKYDVLPQNTVYVGDSDVDVFLGKKAGVRTVGVEWGFRGREELINAGADVVVKNAGELKEVLISG